MGRSNSVSGSRKKIGWIYSGMTVKRKVEEKQLAQ